MFVATDMPTRATLGRPGRQANRSDTGRAVHSMRYRGSITAHCQLGHRRCTRHRRRSRAVAGNLNYPSGSGPSRMRGEESRCVHEYNTGHDCRESYGPPQECLVTHGTACTIACSADRAAVRSCAHALWQDVGPRQSGERRGDLSLLSQAAVNVRCLCA